MLPDKKQAKQSRNKQHTEEPPKKTPDYQQRAADYIKEHESPSEQQPMLPTSKQYRALHHRMLSALQSCLAAHSDEIRTFFTRVRSISPDNQNAVARSVRRAEPKALRLTLKECAQFALRFHVSITLDQEPPYFRIESVRLPGTKFWGKFDNGQLVPMSWAGEEAELVHFRHDAVKLPAGSEAIFKVRDARYFVIDDAKGNSHLSDIEHVAYDPDSITFIAHYSGHHPFLFCLIGENVSDDDWKRAAPIKACFQREQYGTGTKGRTPNLDKREKEYEATRREEPTENIAIDLAVADGAGVSEKAIATKRRAVSRRKAELKRPDPNVEQPDEEDTENSDVI